MDEDYELKYMIEIKKVPHKIAKELVKSGRVGKKHPMFDEAKKKADETDLFLDKPFDCAEGSEKCHNPMCGSTRTISYSRQTRSGDEGATVYLFCIECKKRFVFNS